LYKVNKIIDWRPIEEKLAGFTLDYGWGLIPFSEASTQIMQLASLPKMQGGGHARCT